MPNKFREEIRRYLRYLTLPASIYIAILITASSSWSSPPESSISGRPLVLSSTAEELLLFFEEEELVIATRSATPVRKAPAIATVITADEIRNMGARDVLDVLKMVPGFGVSIIEFNLFMLEVRGIRTQLSEKVLFMIDGHRLNLHWNGSALYHIADDVPIDYIKRIEIVRGPGSVLYGANAFVAVINIVTKDADNIKGLQATAGGGSFDTQHYNLLYGHAGQKLKITGSLDYYYSDGAKLKIEQDALSGTPFTTTPGETNLGSERTDLFLKASYGDLTFKGQYQKSRHEQNIGMGYALVDYSYQKQDNYWLELAYDSKIAEDTSSNIKLFFNRFSQEPRVKVMPDNFAGSFPGGLIGRPFLKNRSFGGELQIDYDISKDNHLVTGAYYEKVRQYDVKHFTNFDPRVFPPTAIDLGRVQDVSSWANWNRDATREIWAAYVQDEWDIKDDLSLTAGVRYDHYSDFGGTTNPRVGIVWGFWEKADLKLLYGRAFRAPNFVELYNRNNPVNVGNKDVKPEKITTYEASLGFKPARSFMVDLNYFYSEINDLIIWDAQSPALHVNAGEAEVDGIEFVFTGQYTHDDYWKLSYTYQDPVDSATNERLPYVPLHRATGSVNYGLTKYLNARTDILWTGERSRPAGDKRDDVAAYTTVDLALTLKNFYKTMEIQGTVHNLFDEKYEDPDTSGASQLIPGDFPREGISGMLTASYKF
ncbi:MAG: TonB-dependent receptor [Nitrospirae bacterium]|nr:TonB-dependent receptor [Nitrospirota bacterium]